MPLLPYVRRELYLQAIKNRDASALPDPNNREELFLKAIADEVALIPSGVPVALPAAVSEMLANLPEPHTHTERFYSAIIDAILVTTILTDTTPYISRETAGGLSVSGTAKLKKKLGNTVGVNQLAKELTTTNWTTSDGSISSGEAYIQPTSTWKGIGSNYDPGIVVGHKYLVMITGRLAASGTNVTIGTQRFGTVNIGTLTSTSNQLLVGIFEQASADAYTTISLSNRNGVAGFYLKEPKIIDLTLWFGSNDRIPSDLLSHPENWGRYYAGSLDYNAGYLDSADGTVLTSKGADGTTVLAEVDTGSEVLRSAGSVADEKTPDGTITRRVGVVDLGTLNWYPFTDGFYSTLTLGSTVNGYHDCHCAKYVNISDNTYPQNKMILVYGSTLYNFCRVYIRDDSYSDAATFKTSLSGVMLNYELATPTTEQGTAFDPEYVVEDGGTESWTNLKGIPQGHETEYTEYMT